VPAEPGDSGAVPAARAPEALIAASVLSVIVREEHTMANDREQKIRDVAAAMRTAAEHAGCVIPEGNASLVKAMARAVVDLLDPITRIELSDGFYAEPPPKQAGNMYTLHSTRDDGVRCYHGPLSKAAVEAWAAAAEACVRPKR
jgi:hypothetical protein